MKVGIVMIKKGSYVLIKQTVLKSNQRSNRIPDDTKLTDFVMKIKGYLEKDSKIGEEVLIKTETNRLVKGILIEENPSYTHSFGRYLSEVKKMKDIILTEFEGEIHD